MSEQSVPVVAVLGTLDGRGAETHFVRECVERFGHAAIVVDTGTPGQDPVTTVVNLYRSHRLAGVIGLGGPTGTAIAASAMQALPVCLPKLIVAPMPMGDPGDFVGVKDITVMYPVVTTAGLNRFTREILSNAAAAIAGMALHYGEQGSIPGQERPLIAVTMFDVTVPCVTRAREALESEGYEVLVFHANGAGGRAMEELVEDGFIDGVLDITTTECADELIGGIHSAGPDRLEAMGRRAIPHIVAPGGLDMGKFGAPGTLPARFSRRAFYTYAPQLTLMRTTAEENQQLGWTIGEKLSLEPGPVEVFLPLNGYSDLDRAGQPFYDPAADFTFREALADTLTADVPVHELPLHINDEAFALAMAHRLHEMVRQHRRDKIAHRHA